MLGLTEPPVPRRVVKKNVNAVGVLSPEQGIRLVCCYHHCHLLRCPDVMYHHVTLTGGGPWGFRFQGGRDVGGRIRITKVSSGGKAGQNGVQEGDYLHAINGHLVDGLTAGEAHQLIKEAGNTLSITLERDEESKPPSTKMFKTSAVISLSGTPSTNAEPAVADAVNQMTSSSSSSDAGSCSTTILVNTTGTKKTTPAGPAQEDAVQNGHGNTNPHRPPTFTNGQAVAEDKAGLDSSTLTNSSSISNNNRKVWSPTKTPSSVAMETNAKKEEPTVKTVTFTSSSPISPASSEPVTTSHTANTVSSIFSRSAKGGFRNQTLTNSSSKKQDNDAQNSSQEKSASLAKPCLVPVPKPESPTPSSSPNAPSSSSTTSPTTTSTTLLKLGMGRLPPSQSPTITLLQKAREGQITRGAVYIDDKTNYRDDEIPKGAVLVDQKTVIEGDKIHYDSYYMMPTKEVTVTTKNIKAPPKYEGIGPLESGIPTGLRSGVKKEHASDWYRSMYRSLHRNAPSDGRSYNGGGYMSEPELDKEDEYPYGPRYATVDYRRHPDRNHVTFDTQTYTLPRNGRHSPPDARTTFEVYRNQPKSIAEYEPGHSSIAEREAKMDDEMDYAHQQARKVTQGRHRHFVDGYESDSTLIRKTGRTHHLDPHQQKMWYREIQRGGDVPFTGLAKPAPEKPKEPVVGPPPPLPRLKEGELLQLSLESPANSASPHRYQESEVNIHYRSPIRTLEKEYIEEEELRKKQEAAMRRFYEMERQKKQLQQLAEIEMRRHSDNFVPSQKSPIPLNRYDEPFEIPASPPSRTPEPRTLARVKFDFNAQTARELSLKKGDIVYILKKVDKNWYEGEHHGMIGIFPTNYIEVIPPEEAHLQPRKPIEGQARAKYNFRAQTPVELSLFKGEMVVLIRRVDQNWLEGRIGGKRGIFPASYVDIIRYPIEISNCPVSPKPPASPVYSSLVNGSRNQSTYSSHRVKGDGHYSSSQYKNDSAALRRPLTENLHIDTYSEPIPYRALYAYHPQNEDELELREGDTVYVMEKCDDGWYVGTSLRTGLFGTFPGNYVERI